jgi:hypothetical protein
VATGRANPLQVEVADGDRLDGLLDRREDLRADQDLPAGGLGAQPGGEVRHRPERRVVVPALEPDPAKRRVPGLGLDP